MHYETRLKGSGFRGNVEMILFVAGREAAEAGLQFFRSTMACILQLRSSRQSISEGLVTQPQEQSMTVRAESVREDRDWSCSPFEKLELLPYPANQRENRASCYTTDISACVITFWRFQAVVLTSTSNL